MQKGIRFPSQYWKQQNEEEAKGNVDEEEADIYDDDLKDPAGQDLDESLTYSQQTSKSQRSGHKSRSRSTLRLDEEKRGIISQLQNDVLLVKSEARRVRKLPQYGVAEGTFAERAQEAEKAE